MNRLLKIGLFTLLSVCCTTVSPETVEDLLTKYGKEQIANILERHGDGEITIRTGGVTELAHRPSIEYVTVDTIEHDLQRFGMSVSDLEKEIIAERNRAKQREIESERVKEEKAQSRKAAEEELARHNAPNQILSGSPTEIFGGQFAEEHNEDLSMLLPMVEQDAHERQYERQHFQSHHRLIHYDPLDIKTPVHDRRHDIDPKNFLTDTCVRLSL
jgi:hypothetical protein